MARKPKTAPVADADLPEDAADQARRPDGTFLAGQFPLNHRLRAEALAASGAKSDPDGLIGPELIADAEKRLARAGMKIAASDPPAGANTEGQGDPPANDEGKEA